MTNDSTQGWPEGSSPPKTGMDGSSTLDAGEVTGKDAAGSSIKVSSGQSAGEVAIGAPPIPGAPY